MKRNTKKIDKTANPGTIRAVNAADAPGLMQMIEATGLFPSDELKEVGEILAAYCAGSLGSDHFWIVDDDGGPVGAAYFAPERMTEGTWNLYMLTVHPQNQGEGRGAALVRYVEQTLSARGERLLLIETLGIDSFAPQREFYKKCGYEEEARIRDFYSAGGDKIIFRKILN